MDQMAQPQHTGPDDASELSPVDQGVQGLSIDSADDHTGGEVEDQPYEKKSVISKMKDKAKDKMHKAKEKVKTKLKKDKDADAGEDEVEESDDGEVHAKSLPQTPTHEYLADGSYVNHGKPLDSFGVSPTRDKPHKRTGDKEAQSEYDGFLGSTESETEKISQDSTSVPTDYSSPRASVDAIMPPPVIDPRSASDLGEQSSSSLGEIPEKPKEEEKVVSTEARDEQHQSDPSFGSFGDTTQDKLSLSDEQKNLEAIERDSMSQELGDGSKETKFIKKPSEGIIEEPREGGEQPFAKKVDEELPSDEGAVAPREPEEGAEGAEGAEGEAGQFTEKTDRDLSSTEAGVTSRGSQELGDGSKETKFIKKPSEGTIEVPREGGEQSFTKKVDEELPSDEEAVAPREPEEGAEGAEGAEGEAGQFTEKTDRDLSSTEAGVTSRGSEKGSEQPLRDPDVDMPVPQPADFTEGMFSSSVADDLRDRSNSTGRKEPEESQGPGEPGVSGRDFKYEQGNTTPSSFTAQLTEDDQVQEGTEPAGEQEKFYDPTTDLSSLEKQASAPVDTGEGKSAQGIFLDSHDKEKGKKNSHPPITPQNSTVEALDSDASAPPQSWISKAVGVLHGQPEKTEATIDEEQEEEKEEEAGSAHQQSEKKEGEKQVFDDASDVFVQ